MRDIDVRVAVRRYLAAAHVNDPNTRIVEEMGIWAGSVRIDVAVINGELQGIELKSAKDTLERLPSQAAIYSDVFDRVTLVVAQKHLAKASHLVPCWWGLFTAVGHDNERLELHEARQARMNPNIKPLQVARLFWRSEALLVLERHQKIRGYKSKSADILAQRMADEIEIDVLRSEARVALKARNNWLGQSIAH
jgi:hypothetical protein